MEVFPEKRKRKLFSCRLTLSYEQKGRGEKKKGYWRDRHIFFLVASEATTNPFQGEKEKGEKDVNAFGVRVLEEGEDSARADLDQSRICSRKGLKKGRKKERLTDFVDAHPF